MRLIRLNGYLTNVLAVVLILGVVLNFINAASRYLWGGGFVWAEEIMVFGMIFVIMFGTVVVTSTNEHLRMDVMVQWIPPAWGRWLNIMAQICLAFVCAYLAWNAFTVVDLMMQMGQKSVAARLPIWIPHSFLLLAFALSACLASLRAVQGVRMQVTGSQEATL
jgi:TRAP-type C4-dicarboxylate transport system permease small subunit